MPASKPQTPSNGRPLRHLELLIALVALMVFQSFLSAEQQIQRLLLNAMSFVVVLSAIRTLAGSRKRLWGSIVLGVLAYGLSWIDEFYPSTTLAIANYTCFIAIFGLLISALSNDVFASGPVDGNRIVGAITIYFLLGLLWAFLYALIETIEPDSFQFSSAIASGEKHTGFISEFVYFSNVTLTTLGYGDVTPQSAPARMFAILQAMTGQLYVAIVIARLVGLQISQSHPSS